jgi:hypothetical protein
MKKYHECDRNTYFGMLNENYNYVERKANRLKRKFPNLTIELIHAEYMIISNVGYSYKLIKLLDKHVFICGKRQSEVLLCVENPEVKWVEELDKKELHLDNTCIDFPDYYIPHLVNNFNTVEINKIMIARKKGQAILSKNNKQLFYLNNEAKTAM